MNEEKLLLKKLKNRADSGELFIYKNDKQEISFESGKIKKYDTKSSTGFAVRVTNDNKSGFSYGNNFDKIDEVIDNALSTLKFTNEKSYPFAKETQISQIPKEVYSKDIENLSADEMILTNKTLCDKIIKIDNKLLPDSSVTKEIAEVSLLTTDGFSGTYKTSFLNAGVGATIIQPEDIFNWGSGDTFINTKIDHDIIIDNFMKDIPKIKNITSSISGKLPVILSPLFMSKLYAILQSGISGGSIYRNLSPLVGKIGSKIFDERISISEDPLACGLLGFAPFDHEGTIVNKKSIIENGILKNYLLTRQFADKLNMEPTGNGYRNRFLVGDTSIEMQPSANTNTTVISGGDSTLEEMISDIKEGIYCDFSPNLFQGNIVTGDFSGNLYLCYKIENGKIIGRMKGLTISGNIYDLFTNNLVSLTKETHAHAFTPTFKSPHIMLKDIAISG